MRWRRPLPGGAEGAVVGGCRGPGSALILRTSAGLGQLSLFQEASVDDLRRQWGEKSIALGELARLVVVAAHAEGRVTHARIRELTDQHSRDVTLKLQELVRGGFLVSAGGGRGTSCWVVAGAVDGERPTAQLPLFAEESGGDGRRCK